MEEQNQQRFATKEEILKNLKKMYNSHRMTYKEYMLQVKKTEKYYDEWKADYDRQFGGDTTSETVIDMTNEELAIGKRLSELQDKQKPISKDENILDEETEVNNNNVITEDNKEKGE